MTNHDIYSTLRSVTEKPEIWCAYTASDLWTDEHISERMLAFHLDAKAEPASRPHDFVDRSADWIADRFRFSDSPAVADFGCGPGLYTRRFRDAGAQVTGIDFSPRSIRYARDAAENQRPVIEYIEADYLNLDLHRRFDLITLIYCDYCALNPVQRKSLRRRMKKALRPEGRIFFDVFSRKAYETRTEDSEISREFMNSFWTAGQDVGIRQTWKYPEDFVILDRYDIFEAGRRRTVYNWLQYFDSRTLEEELATDGLEIDEWYSDVAGSRYSEDSPTIAVVAKAFGAN